MTDFTKVRANLERKGFQVSCFAAAQEAADYLTAKLEGKTIGYGGSMTLKQLGLMERLEGRPAGPLERLHPPGGRRRAHLPHLGERPG